MMPMAYSLVDNLAVILCASVVFNVLLVAVAVSLGKKLEALEERCKKLQSLAKDSPPPPSRGKCAPLGAASGQKQFFMLERLRRIETKLSDLERKTE
jgi:hypothetical protein